MSMETFLGVGIALIVVAGAFVSIRLVSDMRFSGKLHLDDCTVLNHIPKPEP